MGVWVSLLVVGFMKVFSVVFRLVDRSWMVPGQIRQFAVVVECVCVAYFKCNMQLYCALRRLGTIHLVACIFFQRLL